MTESAIAHRPQRVDCALGLLLWIELGKSAGSRSSSGRARGLSAEVVSGIRDYVEANLHSDITLAELAQVAELSRYHFIRAFRQSTGLPPYQYLLLRRIERAKEMLRSGALPNEVAVSVGFPNADSFGRTFRRITGLTPKQYERRCTVAAFCVGRCIRFPCERQFKQCG